MQSKSKKEIKLEKKIDSFNASKWFELDLFDYFIATPF